MRGREMRDTRQIGEYVPYRIREAAMNSKHTPGPWQAINQTDALRTGEHIWDIRTPNGGVAAWIDGLFDSETKTANAKLIAASPRMFEVLEQVMDSPREPDKWSQNVRFVLQEADGVERHPQSAEEWRKDLRVQRAAAELLELCQRVVRDSERGVLTIDTVDLIKAAIKAAEGE